MSRMTKCPTAQLLSRDSPLPSQVEKEEANSGAGTQGLPPQLSTQIYLPLAQLPGPSVCVCVFLPNTIYLNKVK